ncbi:Hint domain-containing protein [Shimia isoporae]|uniref:Hint domain-containing protein n=1 Tax=Shimia isoporae TaxID=647720 RepID=A0A4R1N3Z5_9RHOB|nr:Hint domain-containing protein [Shimia isoporae]TCL01265.1 Hint domain-containing protein [Shimia isoporae]
MGQSYWVRFDNNDKGDKDIEPTDDPAVEITFVPKGEDGDLILEDDGRVDPDTAIMIDGETYDFKFEMTGTAPESDDIPEQFWGQEIAVITVKDYPEPGEDMRMFFFPDMDASEEDMNEFEDDEEFKLKHPDRDPEDLPVCFVPGTMIDTPDGRVPVEKLKAGDTVCLADGGSAVLRWVSKSHFSYSDLLRSADVRPVCVPEGSLGKGLPEADLWVSQQHRIALSGWQVEMLTAHAAVFAQAKHITAAPGIPGPEWRAGVDYVHLLFDRHELVLANGAPAESLFLGLQTAKSLDDKARRDLRRVLDAQPDLLEGFQKTRLPEMKAHEARTWARMAAGKPVFRDLVAQAA